MAFEEICQQHLWDLNRRAALPARYDRIGGWWRGDSEADVVAVSDGGSLLVGECKWSTKPVGTDVHQTLLGKAGRVAEEAGTTDLCLALWSRSGFTAAMRRLARQERVLLFDLKSICRVGHQ
jgi:hypothetical protein